MRLGLALACALPLAGCSLIYNPNNIDKPDPDAVQGVDAEAVPDANPEGVEITGLMNPVITEGQGVDGSRRAVLVITGNNFIEGATVQILDHATHQDFTKVVIGGEMPEDKIEVAENYKMISVPVTIPVDPTNETDIGLDVWVTQLVNGAPKTVKLPAEGSSDPAPLTLHGLPEIDDPTMVLTIDTGAVSATAPLEQPVEKVYSKFRVKELKVTGGHSLIVRSVSSVDIATAINVAAVAGVPALAGGTGGTGGAAAAGNAGGNGNPGTGPCKGAGGAAASSAANAAPGGTGGLGTGGARNTCVAEGANLSDITKNLGSGGGGGGGVAPFLIFGASTGDAGGAGGGTVQIDAGGTLSIAGANASGGAPATGSGADGGGGSGGAILLRARAALTAGTVTAVGGGTDGGAGRIRFDSGIATATITANPAAYRGPAFVTDTPLVVLDPQPEFTVLGQPGATAKIFIDGFLENGIGAPATKSFMIDIGTAGSNTFKLNNGQNLYRGENTICAEVEGTVGTAQRPEARDCIKVTYMFQLGQ